MAPSSYYRSPRKAPASVWARHIDAWMRREGLSQTAAFRRLRGAFGLGAESRSAFLPYLANKQLNGDQQAAVAAIIGWPSETVEATATDVAPAEPPDMATALLALVEELGEMRKERQALTAKVEQLSAVVDQLVAADLDRRGSEGPSTHGAHRPTGAAGR